MSVCANLKDDWSAFVDGELDQTRQAQLQEHLNNCSDCRSSHGELKQVSSMFAQSKFAAYAKCPDLWTELSAKLPSLCEIIQEDFSAYLDGELIVPAREGVSEHLQDCVPCHSKFQELSQINGLLSRGLQLSSSLELDVWSGIKSRLDEDCQLIKEELSSYYDREVTAQRHRTITAHLLDCSNCRDQLAAVSQTGELLRASYQPDLSDEFDLWPAIKSKMQVLQFAPRDKRKKSFLNRRIIAVAAVFSGGLIAAFSLFFNSNFGAGVKAVTAESYLIESALGEPAEMAEAMVYENQ